MMLESFRQFGASKAAKVMLYILIISFAAWGVEGFLQAQRSNSGVTVNGEGISLIELEEQNKTYLRNLQKAMGSTPSPEQLQALGLGEKLVAEAVARTVLRQQAASLHLAPATRLLQEEIAALPPFQNERGQFDVNTYRAGLAQLGRTPAQFEAEMSNDLAVRNLGNLIQVATLPAAVAAPQVALQNQRTQLHVAAITAKPVTAQPTPPELEKFYTLNPKTYEIPEHRSGVLLEVSAASISASLSIPASRVEAEYAANKAAYTKPETRLVRHILLPGVASATALQASLTTVQAFSAAANQYSIDPGNLKTKGGDLGDIAKAEVVPAFGEMAFSMPTGRISAPVQSPFGWHLIWVESISPSQVRTLAEVAPEIEKTLRETESIEALNQLATQADELIAGGSTLKEVAAKLGLATRTLPRVAADAAEIDPTYHAALFATAQGQVSAPIPLPNGNLAYVQTTAIDPAATPPLAQIKDRVVRDWQSLQSELTAQRIAEALLSAARAPATGTRTLAEATAQAKVEAAISTVTFSSLAEAPKWLQPRLLEVSALATGATLPQVLRHNTPSGGTWYVVQMAGRSAPNAPDAAALAQGAKGLTSDLRADLEALTVNYLQSGAKVACNSQGLQQVFGYGVRCGE